MNAILIVIGVLVLAGAGYYLMTSHKKETAEPGSSAMPLASVSSTKQLRKRIMATPAKAFKKEMRLLDSQSERMEDKIQSLDKALQAYFGDSVISYQKFAQTVLAVEQVFADNSDKVLRRIDVFDEEGYNDLFRRHLEYTDAIEPYKAHFQYVESRLQENEEILARVDRLLLEVHQLNENLTPIDALPAVQEINELIEQTKLYQQQ